MSPYRAGPGQPPPKPLRGEIWEIDLRSRKGREQQGTRPCLVVSSNALNRSDFGTIVVCPVTTRERPSFRWRPAVVPEDLRIATASWEPLPHWIETDQVVTIDTGARAVRHLATLVSREKMAEVSRSLRMILALEDAG